MKLKAFAASALVSGTMLAGAPIVSAHDTQVGLVNVDVGNLSVAVPINAAVSIANNICGLDLNVALLGAILDQGGQTTTCNSRSRAFAGQDITISQLAG